MRLSIILCLSLGITSCDYVQDKASSIESKFALKRTETEIAQPSNQSGTYNWSASGGKIRGDVNPLALATTSTHSDNIASDVASTNEQTKPDDKLVIKNATVNCRVEKFAETSVKLQQIVQDNGGYITSVNEITEDNTQQGTLIARIDAPKFTVLLDALCKQAYSVQNKNVSSSDVTAEYHDNQARLRAKHATEEQYYVVLKQAHKIDDILQVQDYIKNVREEIDVLEGRQKYLQNQSSFSTITFTYSERLTSNQATAPEDTFLSRLGSSFISGWDSLKYFVIWCVQMWNVWFILGLVFFIFRKLKKRPLSAIFSRNKNQALSTTIIPEPPTSPEK